MVMEKENIYSLEQLKQQYYSNHKGKTKISFYKAVNKMINEGKIERLERGFYYSKQDKNVFKNKYDYQESEKVKEHLIKRYGDDFEFIVYETTILNLFLNHLLAKTMIVVEVPRYYVEDVFFELQMSNKFKNILFCPKDNDIYRYGEDRTIVVRPYVSKAPLNLKEHSLTIEKLLVDIICDPFINYFFEGAEVPYMVNDIVSDYILRYKTVIAYAKRRNAYKELLAKMNDSQKRLFE